MAEPSETKTLIATRQSDHGPQWYGIPVRVFLFTFVGTLLSFAVSLLMAILGLVLVAAIRGVHPDMRFAYEHLALPMAFTAGGIIFVLVMVHEIRHHQQRKILRAIERMG